MFEIRTAKTEDLDAVFALESECFPVAEAATYDSLKQRIMKYGNHFYLLFDGDQLVSMVNGMVTNEADLSDEMYENADMHCEDGNWQMIFGVDTALAYRGRGFASELLRFFLFAAEKEGRKGVVLTCKEALLPYYAKFGFINEGVSASVHGNVIWYQMRCIF